MPFYERQPYIQPLHQIIKEVMRGDIRVPRFQRPGTLSIWRPEQRGDLLDSIYRAFPVGTILLWSTATPIPTHDIVGGFRVPPLAGTGAIRRLLLDGHQRLSTLVQVLGSGLLVDLASEGTPVSRVPATDGEIAAPTEHWVFELTAKNSRDRFVLLKPGEKPTATQVSLDIILNRSMLNRWIRDRKTPLTDAEEAAVDSLRDRLREYSMPVAVLAAESLEEATESFKRINSSGTSMGDFHMFAALAFEESSDPQQQFSDARAEYLRPVGWHEVSDTDVLRVLAGIEKTNPVRLEVDGLANRHRKNPGLVKLAFKAIAGATALLRATGVHGPEALPYAWQLITLAVYLGRRDGRPAAFDEAEIPAAQRWFWLTTYGEVFAGGNSAVFDRSLDALGEMLAGKPWARMERDVTRQVRPVEIFDFRTARSKACALAMARQQDGGRQDGRAHRALTAGVDSMQLLFPRGRRSTWWHLAIVPPDENLTLAREALKRHERGTPELLDRQILERFAMETADAGSIEELLAGRRDRLLAAERQFVSELDLGLVWGTSD